jgi:hypothetical protein
MLVLGVQPPADRTVLVVLGWMAQPVASLTTAATLTAVSLSVAGTLTYAATVTRASVSRSRSVVSSRAFGQGASIRNIG